MVKTSSTISGTLRNAEPTSDFIRAAADLIRELPSGFTGTAAALLTCLEYFTSQPPPPSWPTTGRQAARLLREGTPFLERMGFTVRRERLPRVRGGRLRRWWFITAPTKYGNRRTPGRSACSRRLPTHTGPGESPASLED